MITVETLQFLEDLKANNNRAWFLENKKRYELFKKDYHQLVAAFLNEMAPLDGTLENLEVKNCTFRINRDIRFSKNKTPYKTHLSIWISAGAKGLNRSGYYIHIDENECFLGGGLYCPEAPDLKKIRKEIAFFYDDLEAILNEKEFIEEFDGFNKSEGNSLKNAPKDFEKNHPAIEYLKLKSFEAIHKFDISEVTKKDFVA
ncbi:MAG: DUF2461 domain-containing protein, partial [Flavobacterium sp.]|nr:DUF2461 domain-containing protein [Flavobacterium sp.]